MYVGVSRLADQEDAKMQRCERRIIKDGMYRAVLGEEERADPFDVDGVGTDGDVLISLRGTMSVGR